MRVRAAWHPVPFAALPLALVLACNEDPALFDAAASDHPTTTDTTTPGPDVVDDAPSPDDAPQSMDAGGGMDAARDAAPRTDARADARTDAARPDAGRDYSTDPTRFGLGGGSRCGSAHVQLCEDFESGSLDAATWHTSGTAPTIDGMHVARGSNALHVLRVNNGPAYIYETRTFPEPNNAYWGRMFVYFHQLPAAPLTYAHWTFAAASGTVIPGEIRLSGQFHGSPLVNNFGVGTDSAGYTGDWTNSNTDGSGHLIPIPTDRWLCIEWQHDGQHNVTRFFQDAVEQTSLATTATMHGHGSGGDAGADYILPQFNRLWVGWQEYQTTTETFELWIDEVAVDTTRIGCVL